MSEEARIITPHLDSDCEALHDFITSLTNDMHTNNAFFWSDADEFVHGGFFVLFVHHREIK